MTQPEHGSVNDPVCADEWVFVHLIECLVIHVIHSQYQQQIYVEKIVYKAKSTNYCSAWRVQLSITGDDYFIELLQYSAVN